MKSIDYMIWKVKPKCDDTNCKICHDLDLTLCYACKIEYYLTSSYSCLPCISNCNFCNEASPNLCEECNSSTLLYSDKDECSVNC